MKKGLNKHLDEEIEINSKIEEHENICKYLKIYKWEKMNENK